MPSAGLDISVLGSTELERQFKKLASSEQRKVARRALRKAARPIQAAAKSLAPKDLGNMARTIKIRAVRRSRKHVGVIVRTGTRDDLGISDDNKWYYPAHVELGTQHLPARPFMRPALDHNRDRSIAILRREIAAGIVAAGRGR